MSDELGKIENDIKDKTQIWYSIGRYLVGLFLIHFALQALGIDLSSLKSGDLVAGAVMLILGFNFLLTNGDDDED